MRQELPNPYTERSARARRRGRPHAKEINVSPRRINEIAHGTRAITADTALRLSRYFGTSERFWLNLQTRYDLEMEKDRLGNSLDREVHALAAAK